MPEHDWNTRHIPEGYVLADVVMLEKIRDDLLMRAEEDSQGCRVVNMSNSLWVSFKAMIKAAQEQSKC